jgi:superfamily I DNA/RNA helicase
MSKIKILTIAIIALVAVNLGLIAFVFMGSRLHQYAEKGPRNIVIKKLNFDIVQVEAYDLLIKDHRKNIENTSALISQIKKDLYRNLMSDNSMISDSLIEELGEQQKRTEQIHYNHFLDLKKICKDEQILAFDELTYELADLFSKKPPIERK